MMGAGSILTTNRPKGTNKYEEIQVNKGFRSGSSWCSWLIFLFGLREPEGAALWEEGPEEIYPGFKLVKAGGEVIYLDLETPNLNLAEKRGGNMADWVRRKSPRTPVIQEQA
jgi:hypothetical protein